MKFIKKISVILSILSVSFSYATEDKIDPKCVHISHSGVSDVNISGEDKWHIMQAKKIIAVYKKLKELEPSSRRNVATFRITINDGITKSVKEFNDYFFISGGNLNTLKALNKKVNEGELDNTLKNAKFNCIADYCPLEPNKPKDWGLRKNIVEFFDFEEKLTPAEKKELASIFSNSLENKRVDFSEIELKKPAIQTMIKAYESTLDGRFFNEESDKRAKSFNFINKTKPQGIFNHINELFGENFQLNFIDSEQTIRLFIAKMANDKDSWDLSNNITELVKSIKTEKTDEYDKLFSNYINNIKINIDIASYYDMCANCKATFLHDFAKKRQLQKSIFGKIFKDIDVKSGVKSYLVSSLLGKDDALHNNPFLRENKVYLSVYGLTRYDL